MRILHVASFDGNMGDYANNLGYQRIFRKDVDKEAEFENLELREFSHSWGWGMRDFNEDFVKKANQYDLLMVGGGGVLNLDQENETGVIINLTPSLLDQLETPILYSRAGAYIYSKKNPSLKKFRPLLNYILKSDKCFLTVRNDGSREQIKEFLGEDVIEIPDGGYFYEMNEKREKQLAINIVDDTLRHIPYERRRFLEIMANFCWLFCREYSEYKIVFVPHLYSDLITISQVINVLPDEIKRRRIEVASYGNWHDTLRAYAKSEISMGIRFHSNVCPIGFNTPSIGIVFYQERVYWMYKKLDLEKHLLGMGEYKEHLFKALFLKTKSILNKKTEIKSKYKKINKDLRETSRSVNTQIKDWLKRKGV